MDLDLGNSVHSVLKFLIELRMCKKIPLFSGSIHLTS
jgi:hypothetical protein